MNEKLALIAEYIIKDGNSNQFWQIISFILPQNESGCVYAWTTRGNIAITKMQMLAKEIIFSDEAYFDLGVYVNVKQNGRIWGTMNPHALKSRRTQNESLFGSEA